MKFIELLVKVIAWVQIAIAPTIIFSIGGLAVYYYKHDSTGLILAYGVATIGLLLGIIWATRVWKKRGTVEFMSRVNASPEMDNKDPIEK